MYVQVEGHMGISPGIANLAQPACLAIVKQFHNG